MNDELRNIVARAQAAIRAALAALVEQERVARLRRCEALVTIADSAAALAQCDAAFAAFAAVAAEIADGALDAAPFAIQRSEPQCDAIDELDRLAGLLDDEVDRVLADHAARDAANARLRDAAAEMASDVPRCAAVVRAIQGTADALASTPDDIAWLPIRIATVAMGEAADAEERLGQGRLGPS